MTSNEKTNLLSRIHHLELKAIRSKSRKLANVNMRHGLVLALCVRRFSPSDVAGLINRHRTSVIHLIKRERNYSVYMYAEKYLTLIMFKEGSEKGVF